MAVIPADIKNILNLFLYGDTKTPTNLQDRLRDLPRDYEFQGGSVDTTSYMNYVGEEAFPSRAPLVADFFGGGISRSLGVTNADGVTKLTLSDYIARHPEKASSLNFTVSQYTNNASSPTFVQRAFIWGTTQFTITQNAVLVWDQDGSMRIESLEVRPLKLDGADENFDFKAGSAAAQLVNDKILQPAIDPYNIGRVVNFEFDAKPGAIYSSYSLAEFTENKNKVNEHMSALDAASYPTAALTLAKTIENEKIVEYFDKEGRFIIYGGPEDDNLSVGSAAGPLSFQAGASVGLAIVGGGGGDTVTGSFGTDLLYGGKGNDSLNGGSGVDTAGYSGTSGSYLVSAMSGGNFQISHNRGAQSEGIDTLTQIERLEFANGTFDLLRFSAKPSAASVDEGATLTIKVSAARADGSGPSTDAWVYVKLEASGSGAPLTEADFIASNASPPPSLNPTDAASKALQSSGGFWVKIPAGKTEGSLRLLAKQDGRKEGVETAKFNITSYVQFVSPKPGSTYLDAPVRYDFETLNKDSPTVSVKDKDTPVSLNQSGGYEGFSRTISVASGTELKLAFEAYSIPDYIRIWDPGTGKSYVNSSFISNALGSTFTLDENASGRLLVNVITKDPGTAWVVNLNSPGASPGSTGPGPSIARFMATSLAASATPTSTTSVELGFGATIVTADTQWADVQEVRDPADATPVYVSRRGDLSLSLTVGWRIEGNGENPIDAADFGGMLPSGAITFDVGQDTATFTFQATLDALKESPEGYRIVFFDPTTGTTLTGADGGDGALTGQVLPPPMGLLIGTAGDDALVADATGGMVLGLDGNDTILGGAGDDWIDAGAGNDVLEGGSGSDQLIGGSGSDRYRFSIADGGFFQDVIEDYGAQSDVDVLELGEFEQTGPSFSADGRDVIVLNPITLQSIRLVGQLNGDGIELLTYTNNGVVRELNRAQIVQVAGVHRYELGDGDLNIVANLENAGARLLLGEGIDLSTMTLERSSLSPDDLTLRLADGATIHIVGLFSSAVTGGFEGLELNDGSFYSIAALQPLVTVTGTAGDDTITLGDGDDKLAGGLGDDVLSGGRGADTYLYTLGDGADVVKGNAYPSQESGDLLRLQGIDPADVTVEQSGDSIVLRLPDGGSIRLDRQLARDLPHRATPDQISGAIDTIVFDNGTVWNRDAIKAQFGFVSPTLVVNGSEADDVLSGDYWENDIYGLGGNDIIDGGDEADLIDGGEGIDTIVGGAGNDILIGGADDDVISAGDGDDLVVATDGDGNDTLSGGEGADTLDYSAVSASVTIDFINGHVTSLSSGQDTVDGFEKAITGAGADTLIGSAADEILMGGSGSDNYIVTSGSVGHDVIVEQADANDVNTISFTNVNPGDIRIVYVDANGVSADARAASVVAQVIEIIATGESIRVPVNAFGFDNDGERLFGINRIVFANGVEWTAAEIAGSIPAGAIVGTNGDDILGGTSGADYFIAGKGDDAIEGRAGSDVYRYTSGSGNDHILDAGDGSDVDALLLANLKVTDIELRRSGYDLIVRDLKTGQEIRVESEFYNGAQYGIEEIRFADGMVWDRTRIGKEAWYRGTNASDDLRSTDQDDTFLGGTGDDHLEGRGGSDIYRYASGDGSDHILDAGAASDMDALALTDLESSNVELRHSGYDLFVRDLTTGQEIRVESEFYNGAQYGIEEIRFADGMVWDRTRIGKEAWYRGTSATDDLRSTDQDDTFLGGTGDDHLEGRGGSDTYRYASGDGSDYILDAGGAGDVDALALTDLESSNVELRHSGYDLFVRDLTTGQEIRVESEFYNGAQYGIEEIRFAGGTVWDRARITSEAWFRGTEANDDIRSTDQNDTIVGGKGNDYLEGRTGSDVYRYASGDGSDEINDAGSSSDVDTIALTNLDPEAITLRRDGVHLFITEVATGVEIKVDNQFYSNEQYGIERLAFADGTIWDRTRIALEIGATHGTRGDDVIIGLVGEDTIFAGRGDDRLDGGSGNDKLFGEAGNDVIQGGSGDDTISGGDGDDTIYGDRYGIGPVGANLVVNGSFETAGSHVSNASYGHDMSSMPGWAKSNSQVFEQVTSGYGGVVASDGSYWLDLDSGGGTGSNMSIRQTIGGLAEGAPLVLSFDHANRTSAASGSFNVYWNEVLVATINDTGTTMRTTTLDVMAIAGDNVLRFYGTGDADNAGASLDRVTLRATQPGQYFGNGNDVIDGGTGNDLIVGGQGDDTIDGGAGHDVAMFSGRAGQYQITAGPANSYVIRGADGVDALTNVEELRFADGHTVDLRAGNIAPVELSIEAIKPSEFTYIGTALQETNGTYRLTPAKDDRLGAIWSPIDLSYDVHWTSRMYFGRSNSGADGITFALQGVGTNVTGGNGVLADGTVGISFDTYRNNDEPDSDFSVFEMNGAYNSAFDTYHLHSNLETRSWHDVAIDWNATTHTLSYMLDGRSIASKTTDLTTLFGGSQAYFGFGARTGDRHNYQAVDLVSVATQSDHIVVDPNAAGGTLLAKLKGLDLNAGDIFTYKITDANGVAAPDANFAIVNGNELRVATGASLSPLTGTTLDLFIQVKDQSGASLVSPVHIDFTGAPRAVTDVPEIDGPNEIYGTSGDDYLEGGTGGDLYYYASGEGNDRLAEHGNLGDVDILALKDLNSADVELRRSGDELWVRDLTKGNEIRVDRQFDVDGTWGIEQIQFADGTVWDRTAIQQAAWIRGNGNYNELYGSDSADTFEGNGGGDYMAGGNGSDTYRYTSGDGSVRINDAGSATDTDVLKLTNLNAADVSFRRDGSHLYMRDIATGQESRIDNQFYSDATYGIEQIQFADGTVWDRAAIQQAAWIRGNGNYNELSGSDLAETFEANGGGDYMAGGNGSDTYRYTSGDGGVRINEAGSANDTDVLKLTNLKAADVSFRRDGSHLYMRDIATGQESRIDNQFYSDATYGVEQIQFADGTVWDRTAIQQAAWIRGNGNYNELYGSDLAETFEANGGGDYMAGGNGSDTYRYTSGDGGVRINEAGSANDMDVLKLTNLNAADVSFRRDGSHLYMRDVATGQESRIDNQFYSDAAYGIEQIQFADGTVWDRTAIQQAAWIRGNGNYNELYGSDSADTFEANGGGDYMAGGNGSDTYRYTSGDGGVRINEAGSANDTDVLKLTNLNAADVSFRRDGSHLYMRDVATGQESRIDNQFYSDATYGVEQIQFADGTVWDRAAIQQAAWIRGNGNYNELYGSDSADTFEANGGGDYMAGGNGSDTYRYTSGDGGVRINEAGSANDTDVLKLTNLTAADVSFRRDGSHLYMRDVATGQESRIDNQFYSDATYGVEQIQFADGTVWDRTAIQQAAWIRGNGNYNELYGSDSADTFEGNGGGDYMAGGNGSDTYRYTSGDGGVRINEAGSANDTDVLKLTNLTAADVSFRRDGSHLYMRDVATGQESRIDNQFYSDATYGVEQIQFADGTVWDRTAIQQAAWIRGNGNYNELYGSDSADTFEGNGGGDYMAGGNGSDTYRYTSGDGGGRIQDRGTPADTDILKLTNLNTADVALRRDGAHLFLRDLTTGQETRIDDQFWSDATYGIEQIAFANGTVWDRTMIQQKAWFRGNASYNELYGSDQADTFESNGGGDYMAGGNGSDTYRYASGDGGGRIQDRGTAGDTDILQLTNLNIADVSLKRDGAHLFVRDLTNGQDIRIDDQFWSDATYGVEQISFANGTTWDRPMILSRLTSATGGADQITGTADTDYLRGLDGNDTLSGLAGDDELRGDGGNDVLIGGLGNDALFGGDGNDAAQYAGVQADYQLTTVNGVLTVTDMNAADGDDGVDTVTSVETITFADTSVSLAAPIVLDLNGDGLTLLNQQRSHASFDMDGDGRRDATSWVGSDDGLLVFDRNGDGTIAGIKEISFTDDKLGATSDLDGLAAFDSDFDGILSNGDQAFERFGIWRDINGDGVVNDGELSSLKAAGIAAIGLTGTATTASWDWDGGTALNTGVFTRTDGSQGTFGDAVLSYTPAGSADAAAAAARLAEASAAFRPFDGGMINDIANDKGFAQIDAMVAFGNRIGETAGGVI